MIDPLLTEAIAFGLAALFLSAACQKFFDTHRFLVVLRDYRLIPHRLVRVASVLLPSIEMLLGVFWLVGPRSRELAVGSALLLIVYSAAMGINILRGRSYIDCGCSFGNNRDTEQALSWGLPGRNLILTGLAVMTLLPSVIRDLRWNDYVVVAASLAISVILYSGAGQLMKNRAAIKTWRNG